MLDVAGYAVCTSAAPSNWRIGGCAGCCWGRLTVFAVHTPPSPGRPPPASLCSVCVRPRCPTPPRVVPTVHHMSLSPSRLVCPWWAPAPVVPPPPLVCPAYAQPLSPEQQAPVSMGFITDSNCPQPLWQPPPTACPTASGAAFEVPSLRMHPWGRVSGPHRVADSGAPHASQSCCPHNVPAPGDGMGQSGVNPCGRAGGTCPVASCWHLQLGNAHGRLEGAACLVRCSAGGGCVPPPPLWPTRRRDLPLQGCIRRAGAAPEVVRPAVGGG